MKREELANLNVPEEAIDKIMAINGADVEKTKDQIAALKEQNRTLQNQILERDKDIENLKAASGDVEETKKRLDELQRKYTEDTETYKKQIADRDYSDAIRAAIEEKGIQFSSKAAEKAYIADLRAKNFTLEDGKIIGFDDFHKAQIEADPTAFKSNDPKPQFSDGLRPQTAAAPESSAIAAVKRFAEQRLNIPKGGTDK